MKELYHFLNMIRRMVQDIYKADHVGVSFQTCSHEVTNCYFVVSIQVGPHEFIVAHEINEAGINKNSGVSCDSSFAVLEFEVRDVHRKIKRQLDAGGEPPRKYDLCDPRKPGMTN